MCTFRKIPNKNLKKMKGPLIPEAGIYKKNKESPPGQWILKVMLFYKSVRLNNKYMWRRYCINVLRVFDLSTVCFSALPAG